MRGAGRPRHDRAERRRADDGLDTAEQNRTHGQQVRTLSNDRVRQLAGDVLGDAVVTEAGGDIGAEPVRVQDAAGGDDKKATHPGDNGAEDDEKLPRGPSTAGSSGHRLLGDVSLRPVSYTTSQIAATLGVDPRCS